MIYLDNAATTLNKPESVYRRSNEVFRYFSANAGRGGHAASLKAGELLFSARQSAARFFGAADERCIFTAGCTDALNLVLKGLFQPGDHVLTTAYEHNAVLRPLAWLKKNKHLDYTVLFPHADGTIPLDDFAAARKENTRAVIMNVVSNVTGHVQDLDAVSAFCKENGLLLIADGAQAAGHLPLSMKKIDYLCCAGHKGLYGPQGIGLLLIAPGVPVPEPLRFGGTGSRSLDEEQPPEMPEYLESGTLSVQNAAALQEGILFVSSLQNKIEEKNRALSQRLADGIRSIPRAQVYAPEQAESGVIAFNLADADSSFVADALDRTYHICARGGLHCAPLVHRFLGTQDRGAVRLSLGWFNTAQEVQYTLAALRELARSF